MRETVVICQEYLLLRTDRMFLVFVEFVAIVSEIRNDNAEFGLKEDLLGTGSESDPLNETGYGP